MERNKLPQLIEILWIRFEKFYWNELLFLFELSEHRLGKLSNDPGEYEFGPTERTVELKQITNCVENCTVLMLINHDAGRYGDQQTNINTNYMLGINEQ